MVRVIAMGLLNNLIFINEASEVPLLVIKVQVAWDLLTPGNWFFRLYKI